MHSPDDASLSAALNARQQDGITAIEIQYEGAHLLLFSIDPARYEPTLIGQPTTGVSARGALTTANADLLIGSGYVSALNSLTPVGLLKTEGQTLNPVQGHGYTRIVGFTDTGIGVVHRNAYETNLFHSALQAGPGIIESGALDISERDLLRPKYFRSFVAVCENRWLAGISLNPTHLRTLGQALVDHFEQNQWRCSEVVNLAGDRQALMMLSIPGADPLYHGDPDLAKVSLIGFTPRN